LALLLPKNSLKILEKKDLILNKFVKKKASKKYKAKEFVILYPPILNNVTFIVNVLYLVCLLEKRRISKF
jgi:hypothetical protein